MDVALVRSSVYGLPSHRRVDAIVFDGAADLRLWPGRGPDGDLREAWGPGLAETLDTERERLAERELDVGEMLRIHSGRLHCDFLLWVATRPAEPGTERAPAPDAATLLETVQAALAFVADRAVERVAFGAFGHGRDALEVSRRLELVVRAARAHEEARFAAGKAAGVEEVLVCHPDGAAVREAERRLGGLARAVAADPRPSPSSEPARTGRSGGRGGGRSTARSGGRSAGGSSKGKARGRRAAPALDPAEVRQARGEAQKYDMRRTYQAGEWMLHPKFGAGRVEQVTPEGAILVLFEDGEQRKMVHGRA